MLGSATDTVVCPNDLTVDGDFSAPNYDLFVEATQTIVQTADKIYNETTNTLDASTYSNFIFTGDYYLQITAVMNGTLGQIITITKTECNDPGNYFRLYNGAIGISTTNRTMLTAGTYALGDKIHLEVPYAHSLIYCGSSFGWYQMI